MARAQAWSLRCGAVLLVACSVRSDPEILSPGLVGDSSCDDDTCSTDVASQDAGAPSCGCGALKRADFGAGAGSGHVAAERKLEAFVGETEEEAAVIYLDGGNFLMGIVPADEGDPSIHPADAEGPRRKVDVPPFGFGAFEVSNRRFATFVEGTGYVTEAEEYGWSFGVDAFVQPELRETLTQEVAVAPWWVPVNDSNWRQPNGPGTSIVNVASHPVTQVSLRDAEAFCRWSRPGGRLPTEAEWEFAARGGKKQRRFPWGQNPLTGPSKDTHRMNVWQSEKDAKLIKDGKVMNLNFYGEHSTALLREYYSAENIASDGYAGTAPVEAYGPQNTFGFYNMVGNVWEWTSTHWKPVEGGPLVDPNTMVKKGGSFMCNPATCYRFRSSARMMFTADSAASNVGFRCAYPPQKQ